MIIKITIYLIILSEIIFSQSISVADIFPQQDIVGASRQSIISVQVNNSLDSLSFSFENLFRVYGSNSGLITGSVEIDSLNKNFTFKPFVPLYAGEIINASFGPLYSSDDTLKTFNWRFTIEITNPTNAQFDSVARFNVASLFPIAVDYNNDGYIDIVSGYSGQVIYNNGDGKFLQAETVEGLIDAEYLVDLNNDDLPDVITKAGGGVEIYLRAESGDYEFSETLYPYQMNGGKIAAQGDINGDGFIDLMAIEYQNESDNYWRIFLNDQTGKFIRDTSAVFIENWITEADLVDMDKDGDLDFVFLNTWVGNPSEDFEGMYLYYNNGKGEFQNFVKEKFTFEISNFSLADLRQLFIIDYDNNSLNDIAAFGSQLGGGVMFQTDLGTFETRTGFGAPENFAFFTSGDMNGDNRFDAVISNFHIWGPSNPDDSFYVLILINCQEKFFECDPESGGGFYLGTREEIGSVVPIVADVDNDGDLDIIHSGYPTTITYNENIITDINKESIQPVEFYLFQNYPNPFNNTTKIEYIIPMSGHVKINIYNIIGELVQTLFDEFQNAGNYYVIINSNGLNSGLYFYTIRFGNQSLVKKMIYLK